MFGYRQNCYLESNELSNINSCLDVRRIRIDIRLCIPAFCPGPIEEEHANRRSYATAPTRRPACGLLLFLPSPIEEIRGPTRQARRAPPRHLQELRAPPATPLP